MKKYRLEVSFKTPNGGKIAQISSNDRDSLTVEKARDFIEECGYSRDCPVLTVNHKRKFLFFYI